MFLGTTMYIFLAKYIKTYNSKPGPIQNKVVTILTDAGQTCGLYTHQLLGMRVICWLALFSIQQTDLTSFSEDGRVVKTVKSSESNQGQLHSHRGFGGQVISALAFHL